MTVQPQKTPSNPYHIAYLRNVIWIRGSLLWLFQPLVICKINIILVVKCIIFTSTTQLVPSFYTYCISWPEKSKISTTIRWSKVTRKYTYHALRERFQGPLLTHWTHCSLAIGHRYLLRSALKNVAHGRLTNTFQSIYTQSLKRIDGGG